ncbi:MAG: Gfo/Idh/MocA family oxidoreductase [Lachnospiraceae bacterium]|nr:Gfo/Idh/MocA family oxidoreductase [Lachnospiraceae bacterium]
MGKRTKLRYGMVGGSLGAFIGAVHRRAIALEETGELVAGCFSSKAEKNQDTASFYGLKPDRVYNTYKEMAEKEAAREDAIDFVCITTPNATHYEIAKAFLQAGINVACEKPLCFTVEQAEELERLTKEKNLFFAVTYTYTGYNMVKLAKEIVESGEIGTIVNVNAEYLQDWLIDEIGAGNQTTTKLSVWRTDPAKSGISNCVGDIGTHIEDTVGYITGMHPKKVAAVLDHYGMELDLNANILVEYENGAHGVYCCSQVCAGHLNGLVIRIFGSDGAIEWVQEDPNYLKVTRKGQPTQIYNRGTGYITGRAAELNHIPSGHPEGLTYAFANIYHGFMGAVLKRINGEEVTDADLDFPDVRDGAMGVRFIKAVVESSKNGFVWTEL